MIGFQSVPSLINNQPTLRNATNKEREENNFHFLRWVKYFLANCWSQLFSVLAETLAVNYFVQCLLLWFRNRSIAKDCTWPISGTCVSHVLTTDDEWSRKRVCFLFWVATRLLRIDIVAAAKTMLLVSQSLICLSERQKFEGIRPSCVITTNFAGMCPLQVLTLMASCLGTSLKENGQVTTTFYERTKCFFVGVGWSSS